LPTRAGNPELLERGDEIGDLRIGMNRRWREARALHAARHRRAIDGQHVDPVVVEQAVGYRLAVDWIPSLARCSSDFPSPAGDHQKGKQSRPHIVVRDQSL